MKALVYTGVEEMEFREEKNLLKNLEKVFLKFMHQVSVAQICMPTTEKMREEFHR